MAAMVSFVLLVPIWGPAACVLQWRYRARMRRVVCGFTCLTCGARLGLEAIRLGDEHQAKKVAELHAKYRGERLRIIKEVDAICPECGAEYSFRDKEQVLVGRFHG